MALAIFSSTLLFSGCQKDLYDPEYAASKKGLIAGVPSDFNWSTLSSVNLTINVDDQYNGVYNYVVGVYNNNPLFSSDAKLLSKGVAKKGTSFSSQIAIPQGTKTLYICQTSPNGNREVATVTVSSENLTYTFGNSVATKSTAVSTRSVTTRADGGFTYPTYNSVPSGAEIISASNNTIATGGVYAITADYQGDINFPGPGNATLYVKGKWTNTASSFTLQDKMNIIILDGGEFATNTDLAITGSNAPSIVIMPTGKFNSGNKKVDINFNTNGTIINEGTLYLNSLSLPSSASLYNNGKSSISTLTVNASNNIVNDNELNVNTLGLINGILTNNYKMNIGNLITNGTTITNSGTIVADNITLGGGIFTNNCKVIVNNNIAITNQQVTLNLGSNTLFQGQSLNCANLIANMNEGSILYISDQAKFTLSTTFNGTGSDYALLKMKSVSIINANNLVNYKGKLKVEAQSHTNNTPHTWDSGYFTDYYSISDGATLSKFSEAEIIIPASSCTIGNTPKENTPTNPSYPINVDLGTTYTYLMEDLWPNYGDYDMNDLVVAIKPQYALSSSNHVQSMTFETTLKAIGATKPLAAAIQLDNVSSSSVSGVSYSVKSTNGTVFETSNGTETNNDKAVIPLYDDAHGFLGSSDIVNTVKGGTTAPEKTVIVTVTFIDGTVKVNDISDIKKDLNFFIVTDKQKTNRTEVHLRGFNATNHVNKSLFGTGVDASNNGMQYKSMDNQVWGMIVPDNFKYPIEGVSILKVYPKFKEWAVSGGKNNVDWYNTNDSSIIY